MGLRSEEQQRLAELHREHVWSLMPEWFTDGDKDTGYIDRTGVQFIFLYYWRFFQTPQSELAEGGKALMENMLDRFGD